MKKMLVLVFAVILVMSMAVPAAALASPTAKVEDLKPVLTEKSTVVVEIHTTEEVLELSEDIQEVMADAKEELKDACPEGFAVKHFCYVQIIGSESTVSVDFESINGVSAEDVSNGRLLIMQFVNGEWVELDFAVNADGTITILGVVEGPIAFFIK